MNKLIARGGLVAVRDLADFIGMSSSHLLKTLKKSGVPLDKLRSPEARGQFVSVVSRSDAEAFLAARRAESIVQDGTVEYITA